MDPDFRYFVFTESDSFVSGLYNTEKEAEQYIQDSFSAGSIEAGYVMIGSLDINELSPEDRCELPFLSPPEPAEPEPAEEYTDEDIFWQLTSCKELPGHWTD